MQYANIVSIARIGSPSGYSGMGGALVVVLVAAGMIVKSTQAGPLSPGGFSETSELY